MLVDRAAHVGLKGLQQVAVGLQHVVEPPGVLPVPLDQVRRDLVATVHQPLNRLGDLQLTPARRLDCPHRLMDGHPEEVDTDKSKIARRLLGLLDQADDVALRAELRHTERGRIGDLGQQNQRVRPTTLEFLHEPGDTTDDQVVAEIHHERLVREEITCDEDGVRKTQRRLLTNVGDLDTQRGTVADRGLDLRRGIAYDDPDFGDTRFGDRFQPVEEHRLVRHGNELLG